MPTPEEIVKAAEEQEAEAKRKAEHQVQDLRQLNPNVGPDEEAESVVPTENIILGAHDESAEDLGSLNKAELVEKAGQQGLDTSGTKADLLERLGG